MRRVSKALVGVGLLALAMGACEKRREEPQREPEGTAEEAGKKVDQGLDAAGKKLDEMGREIKEGGQAAADKAGEAAHDVGQAAERGVHEVGQAADRAGEGIKKGTEETGAKTERALEPKRVENVPGEVGAEVSNLPGPERMTQATTDATTRLNTCEMGKPMYFFFKPAASSVSGGELTRANKLATCLKEHPSGKAVITVVAYGDTSTDAKKNVEMGLKRANSVAQILIKGGAPPNQVLLQSMSDISPAKDDAGRDNGDWARRVAVVVTQ